MPEKLMRFLVFLPILLNLLSRAAENEITVSAAEYIALWKHEAIYQMAVHKVPASITLAQGMLESGNGNSRLAREGNNHFGIKCHNDWDGKKIHEDDETRGECFRKYKDPKDSFDDHSVFLQKKRYSPLFELDITDYKGWARGLKQCGYATNPQYPQSLIRLIEAHHLELYDEEGLRYIRKNQIPPRSDSDQKGHKPSENDISQQKPPRKKRGWDPDQPDPLTIQSGRTILANENAVRYTIAREGDDAGIIASDLEMGAWQIRKYNDLKDGGNINAGDIVYLQPKRGKVNQANYTVKEGDSMWSISQQFGIRLSKLYRINQIEYDSALRAGAIIKLRK